MIGIRFYFFGFRVIVIVNGQDSFTIGRKLMLLNICGQMVYTFTICCDSVILYVVWLPVL